MGSATAARNQTQIRLEPLHGAQSFCLRAVLRLAQSRISVPTTTCQLDPSALFGALTPRLCMLEFSQLVLRLRDAWLQHCRCESNIPQNWSQRRATRTADTITLPNAHAPTKITRFSSILKAFGITTPPTDPILLPVTAISSLKMVLNEGSYHCPHCHPTGSRKFSTSNDLQRHIKFVHKMPGQGDPIWRCRFPGCATANKIWTWRDGFESHLKTTHFFNDNEKRFNFADTCCELFDYGSHGSLKATGIAKASRSDTLTVLGDGDAQDKSRGTTKVPRQRSHTQDHLPALFACPYSKFDPAISHSSTRPYWMATDCWKGFFAISDLQCHLRRSHTEPEIYCDQCFQPFDTVFQKNQHVKDFGLRGCGVGEKTKPFPGKLDPKQHELVYFLDRPQGIPEDVWYNIYAILFPGCTRPTRPYLGIELENLSLDRRGHDQQTLAPTDSGYASLSPTLLPHGKTLEENAWELQTEYSATSMETTRKDDLIQRFAERISNDLGNKTFDSFSIAKMSESLPTLLADFALRLGQASLSRDLKEVSFFIRKYRR